MASTPYLPLMAGDGMWIMLFLVCVAVLYVTVRLLHLASLAAVPEIICRLSAFNQRVISACPLLTETYVPPLIWGKSGHLQTIIYGRLGRVKSPFPKGERCYITMPDGATMTFDIFEPLSQHPHGDLTLLICPGIANSSESLYVCTCVDYAQNNGYRVAVLNHLGALKNVRLTAPRIYTYGGTEEYGAMVDEVLDRYPTTKLIACGFSMGGNIVVKYLGEQENQHKFIAGISCCQGYDAEMAQKDIMRWAGCQRAYCFAMTQHQKQLMRHHMAELFGQECHEKYGEFDVAAVMRASSLVEIDEVYSRRRAGFATLQEYYRAASCKHYIQNVTIPMFLLNAYDDPIISERLLSTASEFAKSRDNVLHVRTAHGGHLGFFEGGIALPETITWLDKIVVQYSDAVAAIAAAESAATSGGAEASRTNGHLLPAKA